MKRPYLFAVLLVWPQIVLAATITGKLTGGGGSDNRAMTVRSSDGKEISAYCVTKVCDQFLDEDTDGYGGTSLKKKFKGTRVIMEYQIERNRDRMAGPHPDDRVEIVKQLTIVK
ncbi:hypothetical protein INH39_09200 [Massilia violaceinigra]|uniref:DUF2147 domain-containing protein n=1 Tax=Massilia violaceinigra TaxID=2045208 RepID=A0ABY4AAK2_9BURK|nr:hypothetical protein [Massilia violaceinigra]UOD31835.1 hypothetical protein INH39_09200 [Massilia violaceinigra]